MDTAEQIARGLLVCPKTKAPLFLRTRQLAAANGACYPLHQGVPIVIDGAAQRDYLSQNNGSMAAEYDAQPATPASAPSPPRPRGPRAAFRRWLDLASDHRSAASIAAYHAAITNQPADALLISVGGGPQRQDPRLTNINIGPFRNVDVVADAYCLPYADNSVDGVYCEAVLEHLEFPDRAAAEMARVLKPGGQLFAATPFLQPYHGYPNHFQNFTLTGHERLFLRQGLEVITSGVCVGPSFVLSQLASGYLTHFCRRLIPGRVLTVLLGLLRKRDDHLNRREQAADYASTTFVHARKPCE
jgi:SAM-dependent methyltransferase